jgi:signal peptidase I
MNREAELLKCQLAAETLRASGYLRLRCTGFSMLPAVFPGDILHVERCGMGEIRVGSIVMFEGYGRLVAHRVIGRADSALITRGDSMPAADPPVTEAALLGTVFSIERGRRKFRPSERPGPVSRLGAAVAQRSAHASKWLGRAGSLLSKECL